MRKSRVWAALALLLALAPPLALAAPSAGLAPAHKVLPNGLDVFVVENPAVPLVTICVAFRGGAIAQDRDTAGLFHLYEHMLFKANAKYPNQAAFFAALNRMGVANWNGSTGDGIVDYYITIPSDKLEEGVEFWSWAVKSPTLDPAELESEKDVVINEIRGYHADPDEVMYNAIETRAFPDAPWRKNIDGPEENIRGATVEKLKAMRDAYYIPKNAAVFIGGDVAPDRAFAAVERFFGDWKGGEAPEIGEPPQGPVPEGVALVYPDADYYDGVALAQVLWRGPDALRETTDTYVSDVLIFLLTSPVGEFKSALMEKGPGLYDPEYISFNYPTARDGGEFSLGAFLLLEGPGSELPALDRAEALRELALGEFESIAADPAAYFGPGELEKAKAKLIDQNILASEVAADFVSGTLPFWWAVATADYYFGYEKACSAVTWDDVSELARRRLVEADSAIALRLRSDAFDADPAMRDKIEELGYEVVSDENAFWWQRD